MLLPFPAKQLLPIPRQWLRRHQNPKKRTTSFYLRPSFTARKNQRLSSNSRVCTVQNNQSDKQTTQIIKKAAFQCLEMIFSLLFLPGYGVPATTKGRRRRLGFGGKSCVGDAETDIRERQRQREVRT